MASQSSCELSRLLLIHAELGILEALLSLVINATFLIDRVWCREVVNKRIRSSYSVLTNNQICVNDEHVDASNFYEEACFISQS